VYCRQRAVNASPESPPNEISTRSPIATASGSRPRRPAAAAVQASAHRLQRVLVGFGKVGANEPVKIFEPVPQFDAHRDLPPRTVAPLVQRRLGVVHGPSGIDR